jgi:hypothetical protein
MAQVRRSPGLTRPLISCFSELESTFSMRWLLPVLQATAGPHLLRKPRLHRGQYALVSKSEM